MNEVSRKSRDIYNYARKISILINKRENRIENSHLTIHGGIGDERIESFINCHLEENNRRNRLVVCCPRENVDGDVFVLSSSKEVFLVAVS